MAYSNDSKPSVVSYTFDTEEDSGLGVGYSTGLIAPPSNSVNTQTYTFDTENSATSFTFDTKP